MKVVSIFLCIKQITKPFSIGKDFSFGIDEDDLYDACCTTQVVMV